jgi:hypothetical protein
MSDVVSNDELNALAAEYVLGTLDYEERKGANALLEVDAAFRGIVRIWERRFGDLHLMVEAVEPDPQLWARIKPKITGIEQLPPAIPPSADEAAAAAAAAAAPKADAASATPPTEAASTTPPADPAAAAPAGDAAAPAAEAPATEPKADAPAAEAKPAGEAKPAAEATPPAEAEPAAGKPAEAKPAAEAHADAKAAAIAETELKLAELAALLPVAGESAPAALATPTEPAPAPEEGLHTHAPDVVPRGFVPPAPMSTRGSPMVVEVPVHTGGRGWMAATLVMALVAVALAGLISAWRFFPERLPAQLRATTVLNLSPQPSQGQPKARPRLTPFDE